jgi:uncharacterized protein (TIGR02246 family)
MSDETAIQYLLNRYSEGATRADWDMVMSTFTEDGVWEIPGNELRGHEAIRAAMSAFTMQFAHYVQINSPATILVEGDRATARSIVRECGRYKERDEALEVMGFYHDELVRTAAGWLFARKRFETIGMQEFKLSAPRQLG